MKENSIEEDIKRIKQRIEDVKEYLEYGLPYSEYLDLENSFDHILSDYKRILKENEQLRTEVNSLKEENEEWREAYQEEKDKQFKLIRKNQELEKRWDNDIHRLQDTLDNVNAKRIKLLKENEELKIDNDIMKQDLNGNVLYVDELEENYISKDKIKEILEETEITDFNSLVEMFLKINKLLESE